MLPATGQNIIYGLVGGILLVVIAIALFVSSRRKNRK
jgi:LPXTG-motif cell wall-anchored protein